MLRFFFCYLAVLGGSHLELVAEKGGKMAATGKAALLNDESNGIGGLSQQVGGMAQAPVVEEIANGKSVGALADGSGHGIIVGAEFLGERLAIEIAIGIGLLLAHELADAVVELLRR